MPSDVFTVTTSDQGGKARLITSGNGQGKARLLTRENLDKRTKASKKFDAVARGIAADLGGDDRLSTVQRELVEAFAGCCIQMHYLNARLLLGHEIDAMAHSSAISNMVRVASRLGIHRVAREVTPVPTIAEYLEHKQRGPRPEADDADAMDDDDDNKDAA